MKVSDGIAKFLKLQGIDYIFELSGGMITHLLDSLSKEKINIVTMHHEQAAAFAAEGFARVTRLPGVALATSGPGATNLVTGIGSCYFDSVPTIFITGQVNTHEQKGDRQIRQLGFQETDIVSMVKPITKGAFSIDKADQVPEIFEKAFKLAVEGRPGPVLIDVPMNIQRSDVIWDLKNVIVNEGTSQEFVSNSTLNEIVNDILDAKFPLILVGGGIRSAKAVDQFRRFVSLTKLPVVTSLMGMDALPFDSPQRVGFIGSYGNRWANMAIGKSDFILVLGSRLDIRQTGANTDFFKEGRKIVHVDCEEGEINNRVVGCVKIVCDLKVFLHKVNSFVGNQTFELKHDWNSKLQHLKSEWPDTKEIKEINGINPNEFMHQLSQGSKSCSAFITDVGNHQMWSAQSLELAEGQLFLTSGGMGAMGFALPTAIGAVFATKKSPVIVIAGDGGIQLNIQELQTIVRNKLPIKVIILNNKTLGMIRQFQDSYFEGRYQSTLWGYDTPDFEAVGKAYGINAKTISKTAEIDEAISWLWIDPHSPSLLQVMIDTFTNVYPKIAFGKPITEMEPLSKPIEMEGT
jgi:acetolactate synthase-1/2/3 large subunit